MLTSSYAACSGKVQLLLVLLKKTMEHQWNTNKRQKTTEDNTGKTMNLLNHETRDIWSKIVPYLNTEDRLQAKQTARRIDHHTQIASNKCLPWEFVYRRSRCSADACRRFSDQIFQAIYRWLWFMHRFNVGSGREIMQQLKFEIRGLDNEWQFPLHLRFFEDEPACFRPDSGFLPRGCVSAVHCYVAITLMIHSALFGQQTRVQHAYRINLPQDGSENTLPLQIKLSAIGDTYIHEDRFNRLCDELLREISTAVQDLHVYRIHGGEFQEISIVISDVHPKRYKTFPLHNGFTYQPQ